MVSAAQLEEGQVQSQNKLKHVWYITTASHLSEPGPQAAGIAANCFLKFTRGLALRDANTHVNNTNNATYTPLPLSNCLLASLFPIVADVAGM